MKKLSLLLVAVLTVLTATAQWSKDPATNLKITPPDGSDVYDEYFEMYTDGSVYWCYYTPSAMYLQIFDKDGNAKFEGNGLLIADEPRRSFTVVNELFMVDKDGNAICVVSDCRNSREEGVLGQSGTDLSYTAYKVSPEGEMLWGEDGIDLHGEEAYNLEANMNMIQIEDGSYIFSYNYVPKPDDALKIRVIRLSSDGKHLWETPIELADANNVNDYWYCWLANAGAGNFIMLYAYGTNSTLIAQKYDFDGNAVWSEPLKVYDQGGFPSGVPLWTFVKFIPDGKGGAFVGWYDFRGGDDLPLAYVSHVTSAGTFGYESGKDGSGVSFPDRKACFPPAMVYDAEQDILFTVHRETDPNQYEDNLVLQKFNSKGEQLWGDEGTALTEMATEGSYGQQSIQLCTDGDLVVFYMYHVGLSSASDVEVYATRISGEDGSKKWTSKLTTMPDFKASLASLPLYNDAYYVTKWEVGFGSPESPSNFYMQPVNINGALSTDPADVPSAVPAVVADGSIAAIVSDDIISFSIDATAGSDARLTVYSVTGQMLTSAEVSLSAGANTVDVANTLSAGVYMAVVTTDTEARTIKFVVE